MPALKGTSDFGSFKELSVEAPDWQGYSLGEGSNGPFELEEDSQVSVPSFTANVEESSKNGNFIGGKLQFFVSPVSLKRTQNIRKEHESS